MAFMRRGTDSADASLYGFMLGESFSMSKLGAHARVQMTFYKCFCLEAAPSK